MLRAFPRSTFLARRSHQKHHIDRDSKHISTSTSSEGPVLPSLGYATRGGEKHALSEDRVFTSTLASALGSPGHDVTFSDMMNSQPEDLRTEEVLVAAIFDGHGGSNCVEYVAENLCDRIGKSLVQHQRRFSHLETAIVDGFKQCDDDYTREAALNGDNSGCCALIAFVYQTHVMLGWSGDCRAVYYDGVKPLQVTTDHRPTDPAERKRILELGGKIVNGRLNGILSPSRCFGDLDIRAENAEGVLISEPSIVHLNNLDEYALKHKTSFLILATDGVWDVFSNETACEIVSRSLKASGHNPEAAALRLVDEASRMTSDDVSVCIITWSTVPWDVYSGIAKEGSTDADEGEKQ